MIKMEEYAAFMCEIKNITRNT